MIARLLLVMTMLFAVGCGTAGSTRNASANTIDDYGVAVRWSELEQAWQFVDPAVREQQPLTDLERERFKLIQITGYDVKNKTEAPDGGIDQTVEIRLINKNTQIERSVVDHQRWRWDAAGKHYWLVSGLPNLSAR
jgi:hypothetical protein